MKTLKKMLLADRSALIVPVATMAGFFGVLYLVYGIISVTSSDVHNLVLMAGVILPVGLGFLMFALTMGNVIGTFSQALLFSQTRRRALGLTLGMSGAEALAAMAVGGVLVALEHAAFPALWLALTGRSQMVWGETPPMPVPELWQGTDQQWREMLEQFRATLYVQDAALDWWWWVVIAVGCAALGLITGAFIQRFGAKALWWLWALIMITSLAPQLLGNQLMLFSEFLEYLAVMGVVLLAAGLVWSIHSLLHAPVRV